MADDFDTQLECPFCLEFFKNPVMFQCSHNLCHDCAHTIMANGHQTLTAGGTTDAQSDEEASVNSFADSDLKSEFLAVRCPECRQVMPKAKLLSNRALQTRIEKTNPGGVPRCDFCEEQADVHCTKCSVSYCKDHRSNHPKKFRAHLFVDAAHINEGKKPPAECAVHYEKYKLGCPRHEVLACLVCGQIGDRKAYDCLTMESVGLDDAVLERKLVTLRDLHARTMGLKTELEDAVKLVSPAVEAIDTAFKARSKQLTADQNSLLSQVKWLSHERLELARIKVVTLEGIIEQAGRLLKQAEGVNTSQSRLLLASQCNQYVTSLQARFPNVVNFQPVTPLDKETWLRVVGGADDNRSLTLPNMPGVDPTQPLSLWYFVQFFICFLHRKVRILMINYLV
eukprot:gb/GEZN01009976.1/.p1 GENE.gb/GEZN01009976.1/~~gb/GEZN01009976.1/.p1  ORF type:complete len:396 (-),score=38.74 gb/GEZN01009976.1/:19-1206(-)